MSGRRRPKRRDWCNGHAIGITCSICRPAASPVTAETNNAEEGKNDDE